MTMERIYELAWLKALDLWTIESEHLKARDSELNRAREHKAWQNMEDIRKMQRKENGEC